ncbi:MAG: hypothetical protein ACRDTC_03175 [Pseudonocardiaceae bacterium]
MTAGRIFSRKPDRAPAAQKNNGKAVPVTRRGALGMLSRGGIIVVAALAGLAATSGTARAQECQVACCNLARCDSECTQQSCDFSCPDGWTKRSWGCVAGTKQILCGECQHGGTDCRDGNEYQCSIMIDQNAC